MTALFSVSVIPDPKTRMSPSVASVTRRVSDCISWKNTSSPFASCVTAPITAEADAERGLKSSPTNRTNVGSSLLTRTARRISVLLAIRTVRSWSSALLAEGSISRAINWAGLVISVTRWEGRSTNSA